jgi:hypothetical protein
MRLITVAAFTFPAQAHLMKALLESEGIFCRLANEHMVNADGLSSVALGGVQLQVPEDAVEAAQEILADVEPPDDEEDHSQLVAVAAFDNPLDAHAAASALNDAGLPHSIMGEGAFGAGGRISVLVPETVAEEAMGVLHRR